MIHVLTHDSRAQECPSNRWHLLDSHGRLIAGDYTRSSGGVVARPLSNDIVLTATQLQPSWSVTISDRLYLQMTSFDDSLTRANSSFVYFPQFCLLIFFDIFQWGGLNPPNPPSRYATGYSRMFSRLGRNVQFCSERYGRKVGDIMNASVSLSFIDLDSSSRINPDMHDRAKLVWEMIMVKDDLKCMTDLQFSREDVAMFIEWCCTY